MAKPEPFCLGLAPNVGGAAKLTLVGAAVLGVATACGPQTKTLPPQGEVLVVVDTDMPVPRLVSRLRIDLYTADHVWYASRDVARAKVTDWPTSFGLYVPDTSEGHVLVRLRAYPEGEVRDYRGERFSSRGDPDAGAPFELAPEPPPTDQPRLIGDNGVDQTPTTEPSPLVTIDRVVRVLVRPGERSTASVVLRGACTGTMADVANALTCVDTENVRVAVSDAPTTPGTTTPTATQAGSFSPRQPCTATPRPPGHAEDGTPLYDEEACVDGDAFHFGSAYGLGSAETNDLPKRLVILPPFLIDRYEVSVGRWRDALAHGFTPPLDPAPNEGPIKVEGPDLRDLSACTFSAKPLGRETYPLNCVPWLLARLFCLWAGGDLPTEAQWEYVAMDAGRTWQTPLPWGGAAGSYVSCQQAVWGRGPHPYDSECNQDLKHFGPLPVDTASGPGQDVSLGLGLVGLGGGVSELMRDSFASFSSNCWASQGLTFPACFTSPTYRTLTMRGAAWSDQRARVVSALRSGVPWNQYLPSNVGFRCVRPVN